MMHHDPQEEWPTQWESIWALVKAARKNGNGFAYYTGTLGWMLRSEGNMDNPWDFWLTWPQARFQ